MVLHMSVCGNSVYLNYINFPSIIRSVHPSLTLNIPFSESTARHVHECWLRENALYWASVPFMREYRW